MSVITNPLCPQRRPSRMKDLSAFQRDLLYVINKLERPSGQAVKEELEIYYEQSVTAGRLYSNLDTLVENGYIEKGAANRRTNYYELTETATTALAQRRQWERKYFEEG